jgi:obg-like ATPase 1
MATGAKQAHKAMMKFSKTLTMGIVGMPNVGKSLLFNLMSKHDLAGTANYPFCTIKPNVARVEVPDERFTDLCHIFHPKSEVPATLSITDIAGLVRGASNGEGLGNEFLSNIRAVNGIYQVVRIFDDPDVTHVEGNVDPVRDLEIIEEELKQKDLEWQRKTYEDLKKKMVCEPRKYKDEFELAGKILEYLENNKQPIRQAKWTEVETEYIESLNLLTAKPVIYLLNLDTKSFVSKRNKWLPQVAKWIKEHTGEPVIPFCACYEKELADLPPEEAEKVIAKTGAKSALPKIIRNGFHDLGLINFFTCGPDEVRGWTVRDGATAPIAGGVIHTDFQEKFIRADVYSYEDLKEYGTEPAVKAAGKLRTEGKNYVVKDGDIMFFKHGAGSGSSKKK